MPFQPAARVASFGASVFTEITELAARHQAIDLSTGFPNTDGPAIARAAVNAAMAAGHNQYALSHGVRELRQAVAVHARRFYGQVVNPETEITITNGAAEALHSIADGLINPGDEVIIFEPFYEVYAPNVVMAGGRLALTTTSPFANIWPPRLAWLPFRLRPFTQLPINPWARVTSVSPFAKQWTPWSRAERDC